MGLELRPIAPAASDLTSGLTRPQNVFLAYMILCLISATSLVARRS